MKFGEVLGCLGCLVVAVGVHASDTPPSTQSSNPYSVIAERNVFRLVPPPPPPAPDVPKPDLPIIKLSGFLKVGSSTRALFSSVPKDKKEGPTYYDLAEGQKQGILEVVKIHDDAGSVEIINSGTPATLTLKDDSLTPGGVTSPVGAPANSRSPQPNRFANFPGGGRQFPSPQGFRQRDHGNGPFPFPTRPMRTPGSP